MAMERTRAAKVSSPATPALDVQLVSSSLQAYPQAENVILARRGEQTTGTLHLTPHHIIFQYNPPTALPAPSKGDADNRAPVARPRELWIGYPILQFCTFRPSPTASRQPSSIRLRGRDFSFVCFYIADERKARDVYDSIKSWTCKIGRLDKLYAFSYTPAYPPEQEVSAKNGGGWSIYDPMREWRRQGVESSRNWRVSKINKEYGFSETYPSTIAVPSSISDNTLNYAGRYRSRSRVPALTYLHPVNNCTITRSSQPMVGVRGNRSIQDEKLLAAIFGTTRAERPLSGIVSVIPGGSASQVASSSAAPTPPPEREDFAAGVSKEGTASPAPPALGLEPEVSNPEALEDAVISKLREEGGLETEEEETDEKKPKIYGAQQRNMIIDARPTINATAMKMMGAGSENMENYSFATKAYLGIDNIHVMRDSLQKVVDALKDSDLTPLGPNKEALNNSKWLKHIANMMDGVGLIVRQVGLQHSHVLIHCSDGWDRTSQLSALSQICLDPYYRTLEGFIVLVEKDWVSFGHRFRYRSGPLGSDKWFQVENERIAGRSEDDRDDVTSKDAGVRAAEAFQGAQKSLGNALLSAKGWFKQNNDSQESLNVDAPTEGVSEVDSAKRVVSGSGGKADKHATKPSEVSPIFHQFLDATYQLLHQYPTRFEFNERFLKRLFYHLHSCQYGTFLYDNEKERVDAKISLKTKSVWDYFLARKQEFSNLEYDPVIDDNVRGKERLIFPKIDQVRWWHGLFGRTDEEMNGGLKPVKTNGESDKESEMSSYGMQSQISASVPVSRARTPVLTGVETAEAAVGVAAPPKEDVAPVPESKAGAATKESDSAATGGTEEHLPAPIPTRPSPEAGAEDQLQQLERSPSEPPRENSTKTEDRASERLIDSAPQQQQVQDDAMTALADDLDPLGIGDVKDHVPQNDKAQQRLDKRRQQMDALLQ